MTPRRDRRARRPAGAGLRGSRGAAAGAGGRRRRGRPPRPWERSPVPAEHQIRGLGPIVHERARRSRRPSACSTGVLGMRPVREYAAPGAPAQHTCTSTRWGAGGPARRAARRGAAGAAGGAAGRGRRAPRRLPHAGRRVPCLGGAAERARRARTAARSTATGSAACTSASRTGPVRDRDGRAGLRGGRGSGDAGGEGGAAAVPGAAAGADPGGAQAHDPTPLVSVGYDPRYPSPLGKGETPTIGRGTRTLGWLGTVVRPASRSAVPGRGRAGGRECNTQAASCEGRGQRAHRKTKGGAGPDRRPGPPRWPTSTCARRRASTPPSALLGASRTDRFQSVKALQTQRDNELKGVLTRGSVGRSTRSSRTS